MAATAPSTDKPAATAKAGWYPCVTEAGLARLPRELNTAVTTAMPTTTPNCCSVFSVPAAFPSNPGGTALSPAEVTLGSAIDTPTPARMKGST
jgi:hypothetical protein